LKSIDQPWKMGVWLPSRDPRSFARTRRKSESIGLPGEVAVDVFAIRGESDAVEVGEAFALNA